VSARTTLFLQGPLAFSLFHNFDIDLLHIDFLIELGREFGLPQQFLIYCGSHDVHS
jgi:hypothetical protein